MKLQITLAFAIAATLSTAAFADNSQLKNQLEQQRRTATRPDTTVAVYSQGRAIGRTATTVVPREQPRFEYRFNARGERFGLYVPAR